MILDREELRKKRLMAIVIMLIIMILVLILILTSFTLEYIYGSKKGGSSHTPSPTPDDKETKALVSMVISNDIDFYIKASDLSKENVGNNEYISIHSKEEKAFISLKSLEDTTSCKYDVIFELESNTFENKYINGTTLDNLNNQLMINLEKSTDDNKKEYYTFDLIEVKDRKVLIEGITLKDKEDKNSEDHNWTIGLSFNNYRDYNQSNNAGKEAKGKLTFTMYDCERSKSSNHHKN